MSYRSTTQHRLESMLGQQLGSPASHLLILLGAIGLWAFYRKTARRETPTSSSHPLVGLRELNYPHSLKQASE